MSLNIGTVLPEKIAGEIANKAVLYLSDRNSRPRGYKTFFMLNSAEHKI